MIKEAVCNNCGCQFTYNPKTAYMGKFCCHKCANDYNNQRQGLQLNPVELRELYVNQDMTICEVAKELRCSYGTIRRHLIKNDIPIRDVSTAMKLLFEKNRVELSRVRSVRSKKYWANPEHRARVSSTLKTLWQDSEFRSWAIYRGLRTRSIKPTKPERELRDIINIACPNEYMYVGDGRFIIDGLSPDFVNINGKKKLVELFGDYFHSDAVRLPYRRTEQGRIEAFRTFGYDCLVIWEHDLKNKDVAELISMVREFNHRIIPRSEIMEKPLREVIYNSKTKRFSYQSINFMR